MQSVSSRIWTRVAVSISCDDNHYTTGTSTYLHYIYHLLLFIVLWSVNDYSYLLFLIKWYNRLYLSWFIIPILPDIGLAVRVFANRPGDLGSIPGRVIPKTQKMVLDASLLNTQQYKVRIKGKVEQSKERSSALPYTLW